MKILWVLGLAAVVFGSLSLQETAVAEDAVATEEYRLQSLRTVDLDAMTTDIQRFSPDADRLTMVWWIPGEFWQVSILQEPGGTQEAADEFAAAMDGFVVVAVVDGSLTAFGTPKFVPPAQTRNLVTLTDANGQPARPVPEAQLNEEMQGLLGILEPLMVQMLGPMGQNMAFLVYPDDNGQGGRLVDPTTDGNLQVMVGPDEYNIETPLPSLLEPVSCAECSREFQGNYKFCPFDGEGLKHHH